MKNKHPKELVVNALGSWPVLILFVVWFGYRNIDKSGLWPLGWDFLDFISELAIVIGLLILGGQNIQSQRQEYDIKQTKKDTKKDLDKSDKVIRMVRSKKRDQSKR